MASITLRFLASSIHEQLKQTYDDADIQFNQVVLWCTYFINKYKAAKKQAVESGGYLTIYPDVPVLSATANADPAAANDFSGLVAGRKYFELPESIFDMHYDMGINYISYQDFTGTCQPSFAGVRFLRTTPAAAHRLYYSEYEKPTPSNPYFYRTKGIVYLLGIESINVPYLEMGLITTFNPFDNVLLDEPLYVGEEFLADITKNVLELGRFVMLTPSADTNDGTDSVTGQGAKQRVASVNAPNPYQDDSGQDAQQ